MVKVNQDPHEDGYSLGPTHHVTAVFEKRDDLEAVHQALMHAGFSEDEIEVFASVEGAQKLDFAGKRHGIIARIRRSLEMIYADETDNLRKIDMILKRGGMAFIIRVGKDEDKKQLASETCKQWNASEICYWGNLAIERMWVQPSNVPVPTHGVVRPES